MATSLAAPVFSHLTRAELRSLVESQGEPSASIYMPMTRAGRDVQQNAVWLKNLLRQAADQAGQLNGAGADKRAVRPLAAELLKLVDHVEEIAREPSDGLAIFVRPGFQRVYKVSVRFAEQATISSRFQVTPLLEYVQGDGRFFVLAVSQKDVRLLEGDKHSLREVNVEGLPKSLVEALDIDEHVQEIQFHTSGFGGRNSINAGGGIYHGHAGGDPGDRKEEVVQYFRRLDDALSAYFHDESAPLVFAGVDYLFPIYQQVNHYRSLAEEAIAGNHERWNPEQLHGPAWNIVKKRFDADRRAAVEQYGTLAARRQGSDNLFQVIEAARIGRVGTLLLARGARQPGTINSESGEASLAEPNAANGEDLLDYASALTLASSGTVYLLDPAEMPTDSPLAALFRY